jgi:hypothetical protein
MKSIFIVLFLGLASALGANPDAYEALTNAERVIFSQKEPPSLQSVLKDLGVVDDWSEKADSARLKSVDTGLNCITRVYKMPEGNRIEEISVAGESDEAGDRTMTKFKVTRIIVTMNGDCHVYYWDSNEFSKTRIRKKPKEGQ